MRKYSALLFGWLLFLNAQFVFGQSAQTVAAAKKEGGKVILYTSMRIYRAVGDPDRIRGEHQAGKTQKK